MLLVEELEPGVHELLYMWLPTWVGMNVVLLQEVEVHVREHFVGKAATLSDVHNEVIQFLVNKFPEVQGLREYLSAVEQVTGPDEELSCEEG